MFIINIIINFIFDFENSGFDAVYLAKVVI
jgi:hypothetical protein